MAHGGLGGLSSASGLGPADVSHGAHTVVQVCVTREKLGVTLGNGDMWWVPTPDELILHPAEWARWVLGDLGAAIHWPGLRYRLRFPQRVDDPDWTLWTRGPGYDPPRAPTPVPTAEAFKFMGKLLTVHNAAEWMALFESILPVHYESRPGIDEVKTALKAGHAASRAISFGTVTGKHS